MWSLGDSEDLRSSSKYSFLCGDFPRSQGVAEGSARAECSSTCHRSIDFKRLHLAPRDQQFLSEATNFGPKPDAFRPRLSQLLQIGMGPTMATTS